MKPTGDQVLWVNNIVKRIVSMVMLNEKKLAELVNKLTHMLPCIKCFLQCLLLLVCVLDVGRIFMSCVFTIPEWFLLPLLCGSVN